MLLSSFLSVQNGRLWKACVGVSLIFIFVLSLHSTWTNRSWSMLTMLSSTDVDGASASHFPLVKLLEQWRPQVAPLVSTGDASAVVFWRATPDTDRPDLTSISTTDLETMRAAHVGYRQEAEHLRLPYKSGTRGIVSTVSGAQLPVFITSLRMLRRTGCGLPVELVMESRNETYICDTLLPSLDARCVYLEDRLGESAHALQHFQFKVFAIIYSSFEDVLFLDADVFLVKDPEPLFVNEPFKSHGLVTWPDFWASTASKHFYDIQGTEVLTLDSFPSTEAGQILVSKRSHGPALLLATYYNWYGPGLYYRLLSQGAFGEGDKETFVAGAEAVASSVYRVKRPVDTLGYYENERYHGVAMLQYDPVFVNSVPGSGSTERGDAFAVHHNYPKLDPVELFGSDGAAMDHTTSVFHRLLGPKNKTEERFGRDIEREMWQEMEFVACELGDKFSFWQSLPSTESSKGTCDWVVDYQAKVFE